MGSSPTFGVSFCRCGGIGRRTGLKILRSLSTVPVRSRSPAYLIRDRRGHRRGVEQLVARRAHNPEVAGSSPASATKFIENPIFTVCGGWIFLSSGSIYHLFNTRDDLYGMADHNELVRVRGKGNKGVEWIGGTEIY